MRDLTQMLAPRTIAIVGASDDTKKVRGMALDVLRKAGFKGPIYPINPGYETIQGLRAYPDLDAVPDAVDVAIVVVAAGQVAAALEQCAEKDVAAAVVLAGLPGGEAGSTIQHAIGEIATRSGMTILGPNALGFWNPIANVAATFAPLVEDAAAIAATTERAVSIVSHSGGIGVSLYDKCFRASIGVRYAITTGNEADLDMLEVIDFLLAEGGSRIILAYVEGFKRPTDFARVATKAAEQGVAIIVVKAGTSAAGSRAAVSHTAHMTGANTAYDAMFERFGIIRAVDLEEMMAFARLIIGGRTMPGSRAMVLSTGGGFGALLADCCEARGIAIPDLDETMRKRLSEVIPEYGHSGNPVDLPGAFVLGDGGVSLARILNDFEKSPQMDAVILCFNLDAPDRIERMREAIEPALRRLTKPALFHSPTLVAPTNQRILAELGVHQFTAPECATALRGLRSLTEFRERWHSRGSAAESVTRPPLPRRDEPWSFAQTVAILRNYGIPLPPQVIATDADDASRLANEISYPVALKIHSASIAHKSDVGGVALGITNEAALRRAYADILSNVALRSPGATVEGVLVQSMARAGREFAIGVVRDPDFGPLLMLSVGGILIEVLNDAAFAPLPVTPGDADRMIGKLKGSALLGALRGGRASDVTALQQLLCNISRLVDDLGDEFGELELNPVIVHPAGEGLTVVDFLVVPNPSLTDTYPSPLPATRSA